jgi:hypothetical protein
MAVWLAGSLGSKFKAAKGAFMAKMKPSPFALARSAALVMLALPFGVASIPTRGVLRSLLTVVAGILVLGAFVIQLGALTDRSGIPFVRPWQSLHFVRTSLGLLALTLGCGFLRQSGAAAEPTRIIFGVASGTSGLAAFEVIKVGRRRRKRERAPSAQDG